MCSDAWIEQRRVILRSVVPAPFGPSLYYASYELCDRVPRILHFNQRISLVKNGWVVHVMTRNWFLPYSVGARLVLEKRTNQKCGNTGERGFGIGHSNSVHFGSMNAVSAPSVLLARKG